MSLQATIRDWVEYIPLRVAVGVLDRIPVRIGLAVGHGLGVLAWWVLPRRRRMAIANVLKAGITTDFVRARAIARASFVSFGLLSVESLAAMRIITPDTLAQHVEEEIPPATATLLSDPNQGVILVSAHLGNWELSGHIIAFRKKLVAVARAMNNPLVQRYLLKRNPRMNIEIVEKHARDSMSFYRPLKSGQLLGLIADQHASSHGIEVEFFGHPAKTYISPARLHLATGCPMVCGCCFRVGEMRFRMVLGEPLVFEKSADREGDIRRITQTLNHQLEALIRRCPEQYLWAHRRWRT